MASVSMTVKVHEDVSEGILKGVPKGLHKVTIPSEKLTFIDFKLGVYTLGGHFTTEQHNQIIVDGFTDDHVTITKITIIGD